MNTCHSCPAIARCLSLFAIAVLALVNGGCETLEALTGGMTKPTASVEGVQLQDLSIDSVALAFDVKVDNPYDVPLPLVDVDYGLASRGTRFLTGKAAVGGTVPAGGSKVVTLPAAVRFGDVLKALKDVKPGSVIPYTADLGLSVDAPAVGPLRLPLRKQGELPVPTVPQVELTSIAWDRLALDEARAVLKLRVVNANRFPLDLSSLDYGLSLAGKRVVQTSLEQSVSFAAGGENQLEIPVSFSPSSLGLAFLNVLRGDGAGYQLGGVMKFDGPFGPIDLPYEKTGETVFER